MEVTSGQRVAQPTHFVDHFMNIHMDKDLQLRNHGFESQRAAPSDLYDAEKRFDDAMYQYRLLLDQPTSHTANLVSNCSGWEELAALIEQAEHQYAKDAGPLRRAARWTGDHAPSLQLWASLLPTDSNMSMLAGGVKLLLGVAEKRSLQRQKMLNALHKLTEVVSISGENLKLFARNGPLQLTATALYVALLRMIEACVNSLVSEDKWKTIKYSVFGIGETRITVKRFPTQTVDRICNDCEEKQREFDRQIEQLTRTKILETASGLESIKSDLTRLQPAVSQTEHVGKETLQATQEVQERGRRTEAAIKIMRTSVENHGDMLESYGDILVNIRSLLQDIIANSQWHRDAEEARSQGTISRLEHFVGGMRGLTPAETQSEEQKKWFLWSKIDTNHENCADDIQQMLRGDHTVGQAPAQVIQMLRHPRVKAFLGDSTSDAILVELPSANQANTRRTALSLGCAMLLQDIDKSPHAATLRYFCGLHNAAQNPLNGPLGIAKMLIGQLLALPQAYDLSFLDVSWREALEQRNPDTLLALLGHLIPQVTASTLFCVIDGANLLENKAQKDDMQALVAELLRIAVDCRHDCHVKLLVTSSRSSRALGPIFEADGLRGLVRLRADERNDVSMNALRVEIARSGAGHSPSPGRRPNGPSERSRYEGE